MIWLVLAVVVLIVFRLGVPYLRRMDVRDDALKIPPRPTPSEPYDYDKAVQGKREAAKRALQTMKLHAGRSQPPVVKPRPQLYVLPRRKDEAS